MNLTKTKTPKEKLKSVKKNKKKDSKITFKNKNYNTN